MENHNAKEITKLYDILINIVRRIEVLEHIIHEHVEPIMLEKKGIIPKKRKES